MGRNRLHRRTVRHDRAGQIRQIFFAKEREWYFSQFFRECDASDTTLHISCKKCCIILDIGSNCDQCQTLQNFSTQIDSMLTNVASVLSSTVKGLITASFAFIIAVYISLDGKRVGRHATKLITAYLKPSWAEWILHVCRTFRRIFGNFLTGQCTETVILGFLMCITFSIFKLPYGSLVGLLTAVCAIIPYVGAFISSAVSIFLTLLVTPSLVIRCLIVYSMTQFVENQFIYPRVVGSSVGLPPLYTLIAAMIGGKLFGIIGIIFFIPLAAVAVELVKEDAAKRLHYNKKHIA